MVFNRSESLSSNWRDGIFGMYMLLGRVRAQKAWKS